jgi:redox-sensing transcriptional repressor
MSKPDNIPAPAVRRLSFYLRQLEAYQARDKATISSRELGEELGLSDAQVRKDLAYFGQFGHPGIGYRVPELIQRVRRILGTDKKSNVILVGVGNLGRALISYRGFGKQGFEIVAVFDKDGRVVGKELAGFTVQPMAKLAEQIKAFGVRLAVLTVPAPAAQEVADALVAAGIRGILNFAPTALKVDSKVRVTSVDLAVHMEQLSFMLSASIG